MATMMIMLLLLCFYDGYDDDEYIILSLNMMAISNFKIFNQYLHENNFVHHLVYHNRMYWPVLQM